MSGISGGRILLGVILGSAAVCAVAMGAVELSALILVAR